MLLTYFHALQVQHETLLRVRKEGNAHEAYGAFRAGFEVLEAIGKPPKDEFEETQANLTENVVASQAMISQLMLRMEQLAQGTAQLDGSTR